MKKQIQPLDRERKLREGDFIVSKTDPNGRITYCNRIFMEITGYAESELLGQQHNIIRHPDMPRVVFHQMWQTLQSGREFFGYVKNLSKDGSYYWVFANVTPTLDPAGHMIGYASVRRRPMSEAVRRVIPLYTELLAEERRVGAKHAIEASNQLLQRRLQEYGSDYDHFVLEI
ncbi:MAG: PAS domain-containing protein [Chromatiales bacterium]|jgi:PAS domain S-box-containing protein